MRILALNWDGSWAAVDEMREHKCDLTVRASKVYDVIAVAGAHIGRLDMAAVKEFARKHGLIVPIGVHASEVDEKTRTGTKAHDHMHYSVDTEGDRIGVLTILTQRITKEFVLNQIITEEFYQRCVELWRRKRDAVGNDAAAASRGPPDLRFLNSYFSPVNVYRRR